VHDVEALADRDVQRAATACDANEQRIDGSRQPRELVVAASTDASDASCRPRDRLDVCGMRCNRRVVHDATVANGSDIP
jgi:hypothetical protein